jgi:NADH:ubiquinone oxidoreductase subunit E
LKHDSVINRFPRSQEYILHILHELQDHSEHNYLSEHDLKRAAEHMNISYSSVYGVASYYSMFSLKPRGMHIIRVCHSPVCEMLDSASLTRALHEVLGIGMGETTKSGLFTLERTECLGQCDKSPVLMVDREIYTRVTPKRLRSIIEKLSGES